MESLKILMSAYACEPGKGSEPGVGWRWALEAARLGHDVWVLTRANNRPGIEAALPGIGAVATSRLHFVYYDLPPRLRAWKRGGRGVHLYYFLWQWGAWRRACGLHAKQHFDAVHHITFGVTRQPSFMGRLGIPFIAGPLGGGERAPMALRRHFPLRGHVWDALRDFANAAVHFDPFVRQMLAQAALILVKTPESMAWLPADCRHKAHVMLEIGIDPQPPAPAVSPHRGLRLVYVGRFLYMKGMELGLRAMAAVRARGIDVTLTMIGQGPQEARWRAAADELGLADRVNWLPWMRHDELLAAYASFDAFLFPSLHDSSGNVVLEAMSAGLPVICLELGGPAQMVDASCGRVVGVDWRNERQVVDGLAAALGEIARDAVLLARLRAGAQARTGQFAWRQVVARVWGEGGLGYAAVIGDDGRAMAYGHA